MWELGLSYPKGIRTWGPRLRALDPKCCMAKVRLTQNGKHKALLGQCGRPPAMGPVDAKYCWQHTSTERIGRNIGRLHGSWVE